MAGLLLAAMIAAAPAMPPDVKIERRFSFPTLSSIESSIALVDYR
jgi:hypothetical protein